MPSADLEYDPEKTLVDLVAIDDATVLELTAAWLEDDTPEATPA